MSGYVITLSEKKDAPDDVSAWAMRHQEVEDTTVGLKRLQEAVGGRVECVSMSWDAFGLLESFDLDLWVNEEGLLHDMKPNPAASLFASMISGFERFLVGDAIITGMDWEAGESVPLTKDQAVHVMAMLQAVTDLSGGLVSDGDHILGSDDDHPTPQ